MFRFNNHHQGAYCCALLKLQLFNPTPAHVGFVLEEMALGPGFFLGTLFLILSVLDTHVIHPLLKLY